MRTAEEQSRTGDETHTTTEEAEEGQTVWEEPHIEVEGTHDVGGEIHLQWPIGMTNNNMGMLLNQL